MDPLQVGGLAAQTRPVVDELGGDLLRRVVEERHAPGRMPPVARYGVVGELGGCGGSSGGGIGAGSAAAATRHLDAALVRAGRRRPGCRRRSAWAARRGGSSISTPVAAQRRQQRPALLAHEAHRVERLAARDRALRARVEPEPLERRHVVGRAAPSCARSARRSTAAPSPSVSTQRVAARREGLAHDRAPAARLARADDRLAAAVHQEALAGRPAWRTPRVSRARLPAPRRTRSRAARPCRRAASCASSPRCAAARPRRPPAAPPPGSCPR